MEINYKFSSQNLNVQTLSVQFSKLVREAAGENLHIINRMNARYWQFDSSFCATHDFFDASEIMFAAWCKCFEAGTPDDLSSERYNALMSDSAAASIMNEAWTISNRAEFSNREEEPIKEAGATCDNLITQEQAAVMVAKAVRKARQEVRQEEAESANLLQNWWSERVEEATKRGSKNVEVMRARMQEVNEVLKTNLDAVTRDRDTIHQKALGYFEQIQALENQLQHERTEREAAQRTVARLGGGIDE